MAVYDYYKLLGIERGASPDKIEAAFQSRAARVHPSRTEGNEAAVKRFQLLEAAYQVLSDPQKRAKYDRLIERHAAAAGRDKPKRIRPSARPSRNRVVIQAAGAAPARHPRRRRPSRSAALFLAALRHVAWWSMSAAIHVVLLLIMAHWLMRPDRIIIDHPPIAVKFRKPPPEMPPILREPPGPPDEPPEEPKLEEPNPEAIDDQAAVLALEVQTKAEHARKLGPFGNRSSEGRAGAIGGGGATGQSEGAVNAGLLWLASRQLSNGSWQADNEMARWADPGLTGLATLAFLGAGYTHRKGRYRHTVQRGIAYIKSMQDREGGIGRQGERKRTGHMYCHAICTLALVEAYGMTRDPLLKETAERAVDFICQCQNSTGGWRYYYNSPDGDSSVSGWMVMALRSARLAGIVVPEKAFDGARKFFNSVTNKEKGYTAYMPGLQPSSAALVAVGLLCNQYLGLKPGDPYVKLASLAIIQFKPRWIPLNKRDRMDIENLPIRSPGANDFYLFYYANLALHQRRDEEWDTWHPQVRETLIKAQVQGGKEDGSWPPTSRWALRGGRVYSTALAVLSLEVYYRYAPIYREVVDPLLVAYGRSVDAYNAYVRVARKHDAVSAKAAANAVEAIGAYLQATQPREGYAPGKPVQRRRGQAATLLVTIYRMERDYPRAIAWLEAIPKRFPDSLDGIERRKILSQCYLAHAKALGGRGETEAAADAEAAALDLLEELVADTPGKNPQLELWVAAQLFQRGDWEGALELYKEHAARIKGVEAKQGEEAAVCRRIVKCAVELGHFKTASFWLSRLRTLVGPSLELLREEAAIHRRRGRYASARRIYESILPRVPKFSTEWWQIYGDMLEMALLEGRNLFVTKEISKLKVLHPEMGDSDIRGRFLRLLQRAKSPGPG